MSSRTSVGIEDDIDLPLKDAPQEVFDVRKRYRSEPNPFEQSFAGGSPPAGAPDDGGEEAINEEASTKDTNTTQDNDGKNRNQASDAEAAAAAAATLSQLNASREVIDEQLIAESEARNGKNSVPRQDADQASANAPVKATRAGRPPHYTVRSAEEDPYELPPAPAAKRARPVAPASDNERREQPVLESRDTSTPPGPQSEEEKRRTFLERNRQAAHKCRERKKKWIEALQERLTKVGEENKELRSTVRSLEEEVSALRSILQAHSNCPISIDAAAAAAPSSIQNDQTGRVAYGGIVGGSRGFNG